MLKTVGSINRMIQPVRCGAAEAEGFSLSKNVEALDAGESAGLLVSGGFGF